MLRSGINCYKRKGLLYSCTWVCLGFFKCQVCNVCTGFMTRFLNMVNKRNRNPLVHTKQQKKPRSVVSLCVICSLIRQCVFNLSTFSLAAIYFGSLRVSLSHFQTKVDTVKALQRKTLQVTSQQLQHNSNSYIFPVTFHCGSRQQNCHCIIRTETLSSGFKRHALSSGSALSFKSAHCADTLWKPNANKQHQAP